MKMRRNGECSSQLPLSMQYTSSNSNIFFWSIWNITAPLLSKKEYERYVFFMKISKERRQQPLSKEKPGLWTSMKFDTPLNLYCRTLFNRNNNFYHKGTTVDIALDGIAGPNDSFSCVHFGRKYTILENCRIWIPFAQQLAWGKGGGELVFL